MLNIHQEIYNTFLRLVPTTAKTTINNFAHQRLQQQAQ